MTPRPPRYLALAIAAALAAAACALPGAAFALEADHVAANGITEGLYSQTAIHPQAIVHDDTFFFAYQGLDFDPYIVSRVGTSGPWTGPVRLGDNPLKAERDGHGAPALWVDDGGYVHALFGAHNSTLQHAVSRNPMDIRSWRTIAMPASAYTYPQVIRMSDRSIRLFTRGSPASWADWSMRVSRDGGYTWGAPVVILHGDGSENWYANFADGGDGTIRAAFVRHDFDRHQVTRLAERYDLFFITRDVSGVWRNAASRPVTLPLTWDSARASCLAYDSGTEQVNQVVAGAVSGDPVAVWLHRSDVTTDPVWRSARHHDGTWTVTDIARIQKDSRTSAIACGPGEHITAYLAYDDPVDRTDDAEVAEFVSENGGRTWARGRTVSPDDAGRSFNRPQLVEGGGPGARIVFAEWKLANIPPSLRMYAWGEGGLAHRTFTPVVGRVSGGDRYAVSARVSRLVYPNGSNVVFLASGEKPFDALAAGPAAVATNSPVLLTAGAYLPRAIETEIYRLKPDRVILVGGTASISNAVANRVRTRFPWMAVSRVSGRDRYDVAGRMARMAAPSGATTAVVVNGDAVADALACGPLAGTLRAPLLLVNRAGVPPATAAAIRSLGVTSTIVAGGLRSVPASVAAALPSPTRITGADRYEVAANIASYGGARGLSTLRCGISSGVSVADALSGSMFAWRYGGPLLLADRGRTGPATAYLAAHRSEVLEAWLVGGTRSLPDLVRVELQRALVP